MTPFQTKLLAAERKGVTLDYRVRKLTQGIRALQQGIRDSDGLPSTLGCIRTWALTVTGNQGLPLPGVTIGYGPLPFSTATQVAIGMADAGGLLTAITVDPLPSLSPGNFNIIGSPRVDPTNNNGASVAPCGSSTPFALGGLVGSYGNYISTFLATPWPIKTTVAISVPSLSIVGAVLTYDASFPGWLGSATASYPGGAIPGPATCAADAGLPVAIKMLVVSGSIVSIQFDYPTVGGGGANHNCPKSGGAGTGTASWGNVSGGTVVVTGDGNNPTGLSITFTPPAGGPTSAKALFPAGAPTVVLVEV